MGKPIEDVLYGVKDYLTANVNTYLDVIETADPTIALPNFRTVVAGDYPPELIAPCPALIVAAESLRYEDLTVGSDQLGLTVVLTVVLEGGVHETLLKQAMRYTDALRSCMLADQTGGGDYDGIGPEWEVEYLPATGDGNYKKAIRLKITVFKEVTR